MFSITPLVDISTTGFTVSFASGAFFSLDESRYQMIAPATIISVATRNATLVAVFFMAATLDGALLVHLLDCGVDGRADEHGDREHVQPQQHRDRRRQG